MRILIVDDHPLVHEVLRAVAVRAIEGAQPVSARSLDEAFDLARRGQAPDLALLDLGLPGQSGIGALARFRGELPALPVVVVSANDERAIVLAALEAGASGYIPKTLPPKLMVAALKLVVSGGVYIPAAALGGLPEAPGVPGENAEVRGGPVRGLTERQAEVLRLMLKGFGNRRIAQELEISENTVKQHAQTVYRVLGVSTRAQVMLAVTQRGSKLQ